MHFNLKIDMFNCSAQLLNYCQEGLKMMFKFAKTYTSNCPALKNNIILLYIFGWFSCLPFSLWGKLIFATVNMWVEAVVISCDCWPLFECVIQAKRSYALCLWVVSISICNSKKMKTPDMSMSHPCAHCMCILGRAVFLCRGVMISLLLLPK